MQIRQNCLKYTTHHSNLNKGRKKIDNKFHLKKIRLI